MFHAVRHQAQRSGSPANLTQSARSNKTPPMTSAAPIPANAARTVGVSVRSSANQRKKICAPKDDQRSTGTGTATVVMTPRDQRRPGPGPRVFAAGRGAPQPDRHGKEPGGPGPPVRWGSRPPRPPAIGARPKRAPPPPPARPRPPRRAGTAARFSPDRPAPRKKKAAVEKSRRRPGHGAVRMRAENHGDQPQGEDRAPQGPPGPKGVFQRGEPRPAPPNQNPPRRIQKAQAPRTSVCAQGSQALRINGNTITKDRKNPCPKNKNRLTGATPRRRGAPRSARPTGPLP
jgi:hypothetical protein